MLFSHTTPIIKEAEECDLGINGTLNILRRLSLEEFGYVLLSMPDPKYPRLSSVLPKMASSEIQQKWTGSSGPTLLKQSVSFVRQAETAFIRFTGRPLAGASILDFGCGYGRLLRLMYYFNDPDALWGVDAWQKSVDICISDNLPGNFRVSATRPQDGLPINGTKFDLVYAFSIFTHLAEPTAKAALSGIRKCIKPDGLLILTVRPREFWAFFDKQRKTDDADQRASQHDQTGFSYVPHGGAEGNDYGDASISMDYLKRLPDWQFAGYEFSSTDSYQIPVILRPD